MYSTKISTKFLDSATLKKRMSRRHALSNNLKDVAHYGVEVLGEGLYSAVIENKNDPHTVIKLSNGEVLEEHIDPYVDFIEWIINCPEVKDNIHFPRVYEIRYIKPSPSSENDDQYIIGTQDYKLERLTSIHNLSMDQFYAMIHTFFDDESLISALKETEEEERIKSTSKRPRTGISTNIKVIFSEYIERIFTKENKSVRPSDSMSEAISLLETYIGGLGPPMREVLDIGYDNIMYRIGAHAPIPVFTDPLGGIPDF